MKRRWIITIIIIIIHGRRLGETEGTVPQKFEAGAAHASVPQIFRELLYELTKERYAGGISGGEIEVFGKERVNC